VIAIRGREGYAQLFESPDQEFLDDYEIEGRTEFRYEDDLGEEWAISVQYNPEEDTLAISGESPVAANRFRDENKPRFGKHIGFFNGVEEHYSWNDAEQAMAEQEAEAAPTATAD